MSRSTSASRTDGQHAVLRGVRMAVRADANAFGYSILITATFGVVNALRPPASPGRIFLFALGATGAFAVAEALSSRFFRVRIREERSEVVLAGTAMAPVSVAVSLASAHGLAALTGGAVSWIVSPAAATLVYVTVTGAQLAVADLYAEKHPPERSEG